MKKPEIHDTARVASGAHIIGDVTLGANVSIWYNCVLRGDFDSIRVGEGTNIQDGSIFHVSRGHGVTIGSGVTIGHAAIIHGCTIGDNSLIGMGSIVMDGAVIGKNCIVAAGALVSGGTVVPDGSLAIGAPAKIKRPTTPEEIQKNSDIARHYIEAAREEL